MLERKSLCLAFILPGSSIRGNPKAITFWDSLIDKILQILDGWKNLFLSLDGRITLKQTYLLHIPNYFLSIFKIPSLVVSTIEKLQRDFFWLRGITLLVGT